METHTMFKNIDSGANDVFNEGLDSSVVPCDPEKVIKGATEYRLLWENSRETDYQKIVDKKYEKYLSDRSKWYFRLLRWILVTTRAVEPEYVDVLMRNEFEELHREQIKNEVTLYGYFWYQRAKDLIRMSKHCKENEPIYLTAQDCKIVFKFGREEGIG